MSYPQFNLTTLQLPAPASNMTKAEYKAAYGIDLDQVDIKAFKLVLLGKDKYPITQIKEVEDGYEIYFNGRILSITDIVQTSDEVYDVANAKPIYYHPIVLDRVSPNFVRLSFWILNNNPNEYTKQTFVSFLNGLTDVGIRLNVSGSVLTGDGVVNVSDVRVDAGGAKSLCGLNVSTGAYTIVSLDSILDDVSTTISDSVNKIN